MLPENQTAESARALPEFQNELWKSNREERGRWRGVREAETRAQALLSRTSLVLKNKCFDIQVLILRRLAVILDRDALKWFKPAKGQFQIFYESGADHLEYQPDFVAESTSAIYMSEPKARNEMSDSDVLAKRDSALKWCLNASDHATTYGGKLWKYVLIPHDAINDNLTIEGFVRHFSNA